MGCPTTTWRGRTVCAHTVPRLDALAKEIGRDILITPIQGSYSNGALSAGTHAGGGAVDIEMDGYTAGQGRRTETLARHWFIGWLRWWDGNHHVHLLDPTCPSLSAAAKAQIEKFRKGLDALYYATSVPGLPANSRLDTGDRSTAAALLAAYDKRLTLAKPVRKPPAKPAAQPAGLPTLRRGSTGATVKKLQQQLLAVFYYAARIRNPGGGPNEKFGPQTEAVVKEFQRRAGIVVDGIVGPQTWAALKKNGVRM